MCDIITCEKIYCANTVTEWRGIMICCLLVRCNVNICLGRFSWGFVWISLNAVVAGILWTLFLSEASMFITCNTHLHQKLCASLSQKKLLLFSKISQYIKLSFFFFSIFNIFFKTSSNTKMSFMYRLCTQILCLKNTESKIMIITCTPPGDFTKALLVVGLESLQVWSHCPFALLHAAESQANLCQHEIYFAISALLVTFCSSCSLARERHIDLF